MTEGLDASGHLDKARKLFDEAEDADAAKFPHGIVHLCYYAMYHAVSAGLMQAHGSASTNHGRVIAHGSDLLAERFGPEGERAGEIVYRAYQLRALVDYSADPDHLVDRAQELRAQAGEVIALCARLLER